MCDETIYWNLNILYIALKGKGMKSACAAVDHVLRHLIEEECFSETSTLSGYYKKWFVISRVHTMKATDAFTIRVSIQALALEGSGRDLSRPGV